jgi:HlyD family type I secretion membrane fusion protein
MSDTFKLDPDRIVRNGTILILLAFFGVGGWIALAPLQGAVIARGEVKVDANRKTVQHLEGGIVKEIRVRDGDTVRTGQVLLVLEDIQADSTVHVIRQQLDAENARVARLQAEKAGSGNVHFPRDMQARRNLPAVAEILSNEQAIFQARRTALNDQVSLLRSQIHESRDELAGLEQQIAAETRAVALAQEELDINQTLADKKFVQNTRLLALKRQLAQLEADRGEHVANQSRVRQNVIDLELRTIDLQNQYRQKATDELEVSSRKVQELLERIRPYEDAKVRLHIDAPVAGTIVNLRVHTLGGVIGPGEPILDIVPQNSPLIVEGKVAISNIDDLRLGMEADVHLTAYKRQTTPLAQGKVIYISADSLTSPEEKSPYYLVRVAVDQHSLDQIGGIKLSPGMPADLYIRTHARTALEYMLEPVTQTLLRAFRES